MKVRGTRKCEGWWDQKKQNKKHNIPGFNGKGAHQSRDDWVDGWGAAGPERWEMMEKLALRQVLFFFSFFHTINFFPLLCALHHLLPACLIFFSLFCQSPSYLSSAVGTHVVGDASRKPNRSHLSWALSIFSRSFSITLLLTGMGLPVRALSWQLMFVYSQFWIPEPVRLHLLS